MTTNKSFIVGLVGVCASGKTTLGTKLKAQGYHVKHIAQEHSFVPDMWQKIGQPDLLVFLDVSYEVAMQRRQLNWTQPDYDEQQRRLAHARANASFYLLTDGLNADEVAQRVLDFLDSQM